MSTAHGGNLHLKEAAVRNVGWVLGLIGIFVLIRVLFFNFVGLGVLDINDTVVLVKLGVAFALSLAMLGIYTSLVLLKIVKG